MSATVDTEQVLAAGGLVPAGSEIEDVDATDTVVARAYHHAVLPGRTVVRLCADNVAAGDDLEMATLGFAAGEDRGVVGIERKRALGFPGWALVHDPKNARYALDVVKELKKHARRAKSKPGHARDGFEAIATRLGKTVPHFLPSFYEEVGRVFIEHGALTYAATMFGKARQTEQVHALEVDEQHRVDAFLEFALAGAVTTKALSDYARDLAANHEPKAAYGHFRTLCIQRTLGGMPPWAGMAKDLGRLVKAAKLDPATESSSLIAEIIESPALANAATEFWRAYAAPITALGRRDPKVRGVLLDMFPTGSSETDKVWLEILEDSGATLALVSDDAPPEACPSGGRAAWFDKLTVHLGQHSNKPEALDRAFDLLRRMAPRLIADGKPIQCGGRWRRIDLDLVELALELGIDVAIGEFEIDLANWVAAAGRPDRGRDPVRAAAHPVVGPRLQAAVARTIGDDAFDRASRGMQGFLDAKRAWISGLLDAAERGGVPAATDTLSTIETKVKATTFADLPQLHARFADLDLAPALARTLQIGIVDELGWPAFEEAARELDPDNTGKLSFHGGPPAVVVANASRAIAVGAAGRLGVHDLVIPPKHELHTLRFIAGDFLVVLKHGYKQHAYWASAPHDVWATEDSVWSTPTLVSDAIVHADGAWQEAAVPMRVGDRKLALGEQLAAFDGANTWIANYQTWREAAPSGELGRESWPAWIELGAVDDWRIDPASRYVPAPTATSPLGAVDGVYGVRVRWRGESWRKPQRRDLTTIDGRTLETAPEFHPVALLRLPGDDRPRPVVYHRRYRQPPTVVVCDDTGVQSSWLDAERTYARGQVAALPIGIFHQMTPRDHAGSRRLRATTADDARALIAAVPVVDDAIPDVADLPGVLSEVTHPRLRAGIAGIAAHAARLRAKQTRLIAERSPERADDDVARGPDDKVLHAALGGWVTKTWGGNDTWGQIAAVGKLFAATDRRDRIETAIPTASIDWFELATMPSALAFVALAIGTPPDGRAVVARFAAHLAACLPPANRLRAMRAHGELDGDATAFKPSVRWIGGHAYAIRRVGYSNQNYQILEYAPDGTFERLPRLALTFERQGLANAIDLEALASAVAAGTTTWNADAAERFATETGMTSSEARYVWAGCPRANDRSAHFLPKELRETLGLKASQAQIARDSIGRMPHVARLSAIARACDVGVAALVGEPERFVDALAAAWKQSFGERVAIPEELIAEADAILGSNAGARLAMVVGTKDSPKLTTDGTFGFSRTGTLQRVSALEPLVGQEAAGSDTPVFDHDIVQALIGALPLLYAELPVGDPIRARAPEAQALALARLEHPGLWVQCGYRWLGNPDEAAELDRVLAGLGGELVAGLDEGYSLRRLVGAAIVRSQSRATLFIQPAQLVRDRSTIDHLSTHLAGADVLQRFDYLRGGDLAAMMERIRSTPVPVGQWEQNPLASAPATVDAAARELGVSREAAALYLQYLVLLWPTPKNLQRYNDWKPRQLGAAHDELIGKELLLEAKRERAQRSHFLPGGWEALKSPFPPLETWKVALYGKRGADGAVYGTFRWFQALAPFHLLFERAWQRIADGDRPRYEEVKR